MIAILLTIIISQSQYWSIDDLPDNLGTIKDMVIADGRNDGVNRVYVTTTDRHIYELTYSTGGWEIHPFYEYGDIDQFYSLCAGKRRNNDSTRIYVGVRLTSGQYWVHEYTWCYGITGLDWWCTSHIVCRTYDSVTTITAGKGRNDGIDRVYIGSAGADIWESTYLTGALFNYQLIHMPTSIEEPRGISIADGRNDGINRIYYCDYIGIWEGSYDNGNWVFVHSDDCGNWYKNTDLSIGDGRGDGINRIYTSRQLIYGGQPSGVEYTRTNSQWLKCPIITDALTWYISHVEVSDVKGDGKKNIYWSNMNQKSSIFESSYHNGQWLNSEFGEVSNQEGFGVMSIGKARNDNIERIYTYCSSPGTNGYEHSYLPKLPSNSNHATAFNEQPHLVRVPNSEELYVVYQSSNKIFFSHSPDGGINWDLPQIIGNGIYPTISLKTGGEIYTPCVTFLSPDGEDLIYRYRQPSPPFDWQGFTIFDGNPILRPEQASLFITNQDGYDSVRVVFRVMDLMAEHSYIYYADFPWYEIGSASHIYPIDPYQLPPVYIDRRSPSISADMFNQLHVAWQRADEMTGLGETYYRYRDVSGIWSPIYNVWLSPNVPSVYPHCEGYGDSVFVHWSEELSSQNLDVKRASRWIFDPPGFWNYYDPYPSSDSSVFPVCASGEFTVWSEKVDNSNFEIYYWNRTTHQVGNLSETPNRSWFGHSNFYQNIVGLPTLYTCWTESLYADAYEVRLRSTGGFDYGPDPYVCFYSIPVGDSALSQYTIRRKGRTYWPTRKIWADYDSTALIYKLHCPNPKFLYKVIAVPYHEKTGQWSTKFTADNMSVRTVSFTSGTWDTFQFWLPETTYKYDRIVNLRVEKVTGEYVPIAYLRVYQFEKKKTTKEGGYAQGGTRSAETQSFLLRTALQKISPNPVAKTALIRYTLANEGKISLKIYDAMGRLVRNLIDSYKPSGVHSIKWNGCDDQGQPLPNGVYLVRMATPDYKATEKIILLK